MNCSQARLLLAACREQKQSQIDTIELDAHLEQCASCREVLAQQDFVGEQIRSLPTLESAPDAYAKLMQKLAIEHARIMQQSPSTAPAAPNFLKPYLKEHLSSKGMTDTLAAFSSAETGPLPPVRTQRRQRSSYTRQFALLGLAATLVMILMTGALTSLLLLANHGQAVLNPVAISKPSQVAMASYVTTTPYTHVVSAVANRDDIYYTAYGDGNTGWMLEQLDSRTQISTSLLPKESASSLIVLGSSNDWLVWLELDALKPVEHLGPLHRTIHTLTRTWRLNALFIGRQPSSTTDFANPLHILSGTFDEGIVPDWIHTPIQGIWLTGNTLLVAMIDGKDIAHLVLYQLDPTYSIASSEIATASGGHILTSPTASSDGTTLYWSEEWLSADNTIHGNIWVQQTVEAEPPLHGYWRPHTITSKQLFRSDEVSFHPQVVNDTLFFLSTNTTASTVQATPSPAATPAPTVASTIPDESVKLRVDPTIYVPQLDTSIQGTLLAVPVDDPSAQPLPMGGSNWSSALQAGTRFLLWQSDKGYEMYDAVAKSPVTVGADTVPSDAVFLAVNGDTAVWIVSSDNLANKVDGTPAASTVTFRTFDWPAKGEPS